MKKFLLFIPILAILGSILFFSFIRKSQPKALVFDKMTTFWKYQCIDTVKYSRDSARTFLNDPDGSKKIILRQLAAIKYMGANCVAIGTPYDDEFIPVLREWVSVARLNDLHVWFRGNLSGWEGWFDYPSLTDPAEHNRKISSFIINNQGLFQDGDIFTPAPEPENGGPGDPRGSDTKAAQFNQFLVASYSSCADAFLQIGKKVECGYYSTNGDIARDIITQDTAARLGNKVTIDHYVGSVNTMVEYIQAIHDKLKTNVVLGEFGAPIPDLNGSMTEQEQAAFIDSLLHVFYTNRSYIPAIDYWTLQSGSTALLNDDGSKRQVADTIKKYYIPAIISGQITDGFGAPIKEALVSAPDGLSAGLTDDNGNYQLLVPAVSTIISIDAKDYLQTARQISMSKGGKYTENISLEPVNKNWWYELRIRLENSLKNIFH